MLSKSLAKKQKIQTKKPENTLLLDVFFSFLKDLNILAGG